MTPGETKSFKISVVRVRTNLVMLELGGADGVHYEEYPTDEHRTPDHSTAVTCTRTYPFLLVYARIHVSTLWYVELCWCIYENAGCDVDCDVAGTMLPATHYCYSDKHFCSCRADVFAVQSCPTLVVYDAYTVPNLGVHFSMYQTRARVKKRLQGTSKTFYMAFASAR